MGPPRSATSVAVDLANGRTVRCRSKFEAHVVADLVERGVPFGYETLRLPYEEPKIYLPDIELSPPLVVEVKGYFAPEDRRKLLAVRRSHPEIDLRIVFQRAKTKLSRAPRSKTYAQWAEGHGFPWAEGVVPEEWVTS